MNEKQLKDAERLYRGWSVTDLLRAITTDKQNYESAALDLMVRELSRRGVSPLEWDSAEAEVATRVVSAVSSEPASPHEPGMLAGALFSAMQSRRFESIKTGLRRHRRTVFSALAVVVLVGIAFIVNRYTAYEMGLLKPQMLEEIKTQFRQTHNPNGHGSGLGNQPWLLDAADMNYLTVLKFLVAHGADVNVSDSEGRTALDQRSINIDTAIWLMRYGARTGTGQGAYLTGLAASEDRNNRALAKLLEAGAGSSVESGGFLPLHRAVIGNAPKNIALLIVHGADPTATFPAYASVGTSWNVSAIGASDMRRQLFPGYSGLGPRNEAEARARLFPIGGMTPLQVAEKIGAKQAAAELREHLAKR